MMFGTTPLLELPLYDSIDEMQVREQLFVHHELHTESLGDVWAAADARPRQWFNPAAAAREWRAYKRDQDCQIEHQRQVLTALQIQKREEAERREKIEAAAERARAQREAIERATREAEQAKRDAIDHEWKRKWAVHTSDVERRITHIVNTIDANGGDREIMRAMLRYMNLGQGLGTKWDADEFTNYYRRVTSFNYFARIDVERCYLMLMCQNAGALECRSQSLAT